MAYFYIVAKTKDDYDLIKIDNGDSLEDIDLYTTKFINKDNFIKHLNSNGLNLPEGTDLFIASKSKNNLVCRELVYDDKEIEALAKLSKANNCDNLKIFGKFVNIMNNSYRLKTLYRNKLFTYYDSFKTVIDKSISKGRLTIDKNKIWLKSNYLAGRDALFGLKYYEKEKNGLTDEKLDRLKRERKELLKDREKLRGPLLLKINDGFDQILMIDEPANSIKLTNINKEKIEEATHTVTRQSKVGSIKGVELEDLTVPLDTISEEAPINSLPLIGNFLVNIKKMPIGSIKEVKKENKKASYEINFNKLEETFNISYSDEDKKLLNGLLGAELKRNLFFSQVYKQNLYSSEARKEASYYEQNVYKTLNKYQQKQPNMYNKAYNFYAIQSKMISNVKRGGHGSK